MNNKEVIQYILSVLIGSDNYNHYITYSKEKNNDAKITIMDSGFFDEGVYLTEKTIPRMPLKKWRDIPILFGANTEERTNENVIIHADIIASAFFLMSRYEELINRENIDIHGRLIGRKSIPGKCGFLNRPVIDEYGKQLRIIMREIGIDVEEPICEMKINLTHDVDVPWKKWKFTEMARTTASWFVHYKKLCIWPFLQWCGINKWNPYDTFDWMIEHESRLKRKIGDNCEDIYFIIGADKADEYTESYIYDKKTPDLINNIAQNASHIGLHISYDSGKECTCGNIVREKKNVENTVNKVITKNRYHYLRCLGMDSFRNLIKAEILDDYTMGYADYAGFRLGTSQCINWIDPEELIVTPLRLHPLIVMDGSLLGYMGLTEEAAYKYTCELFEKVKEYGGEYTLLFHNSSFKIPGSKWMPSFYLKVLDYIEDRYFS